MASKLRVPGRRALHLAVEGARRRGMVRLAAEVRAARGEVEAMKGEVSAVRDDVVGMQSARAAAK